MNRKIFLALTLFTLTLSTIFASKEDDQIICAMLMNELQFSLAKTVYYKDKFVLTQEQDNIIQKIDKSKLINEELIDAYTNTFNSLERLKLNENERDFLLNQAEKEKKQAFSKTLEGVAIPAIAGFYQVANGITKKNPAEIISGGLSIAFAGVSTFFNYHNTQ